MRKTEGKWDIRAFVVWIFMLGLCWSWHSSSTEAHYYARMEHHGNWAGYKNNDGTFTVTGCTSLVEYVSDGVLKIPAILDGMRVTNVGGECTDPNCYYECREGKFDIFSPASVEELILPDTVENTEKNGIVFCDFINLKKLRLPNNDTFGKKNPFYVHTYSNDEYFEELYPKLKEVSMRNEVIDTVEELPNYIETIYFYEGATVITNISGRGGYYYNPFPNLTTIYLPSTTEEFAWECAPKLSVLNCTKPLTDINISCLFGCKNLRIAANLDMSNMGDWTWSFDGSGVTEVNLKNVAYDPVGYYQIVTLDDRFNGCENLKAINVLSAESNAQLNSRDGVLFYEDDLVKYPAAKSTASNYTLPEGCTGFLSGAFNDCRFTSITVPEKVGAKDFAVFRTQEDEEDSFFSGNYKLRIMQGISHGLYGTPEDISYFFRYPGKNFCISPSRIELYKGSTYTITYKLNGGTNAPDNPTSYRAGDDYIVLSDPTRKGYTFLGWTRNDINDGYEDTTRTAQNASGFQNYTFTAHWKENNTTVVTPVLTGASNVANGIQIKWKSQKAASGYYIYRKTGNGSYKKIATVKGAAKTSFTDKKVKAKNGILYTYSVAAYNGKKTSTYNTAGKQIMRLVTPTLSKPINKKGAKMTVKWKKNAKASGYQIQYATDSKFKTAVTKQIALAKKVSVTLSKLKKTTYYIRVRSYYKKYGKTYYSSWGNTKKISIQK